MAKIMSVEMLCADSEMVICGWRMELVILILQLEGGDREARAKRTSTGGESASRHDTRKLKSSENGSHMGCDDPKRCHEFR